MIFQLGCLFIVGNLCFACPTNGRLAFFFGPLLIRLWDGEIKICGMQFGWLGSFVWSYELSVGKMIARKNEM